MKKIIFGIMLFLFPLLLFSATLTENFSKEFPFEKGNRLSIENVNGNITVEEWDKNILRIEVVKTAKGTNESSAKEALANAHVDIQAVKSGVSVKVQSPKSWSFFSWLWGSGSSVEVTFRVFLPQSARMQLSSVNGSIYVNVKESELTAETVNGQISANGMKLLTAATVNGRIDFDSENIIKIESVNGAINGSVLSEKPRTASVEAVNGSITLRFKDKASFSLSLENVNGSIVCDFKEVEGTKREKSGDINGGGETIAVETVNGSIEVTTI